MSVIVVHPKPAQACSCGPGRSPIGSVCLMCDGHMEDMRVELVRLRDAANEVVNLITTKDVRGIKHEGFVALLKLSKLLRSTSASTTPTKETP